jgi:hypothetical protein
MSNQTVADFVTAMVKRGVKRDREIGVDRLPFELVFVNQDSGWRKVGSIEVSDRDRVVWLYEGQ